MTAAVAIHREHLVARYDVSALAVTDAAGVIERPRIQVTAEPTMTKDETSKYSERKSDVPGEKLSPTQAFP